MIINFFFQVVTNHCMLNDERVFVLWISLSANFYFSSQVGSDPGYLAPDFEKTKIIMF